MAFIHPPALVQPPRAAQPPSIMLATNADGHQSLAQPFQTQSYTGASGGARPASEKGNTASTTPSPVAASSTLPQPDLPEDWLDRYELLKLKDELERSQPPADGLLLQKAKTLVHHGLLADHILSNAHSLYKEKLSQAQATIVRLETDLAALPAFYTSQSQLEKQRLRVENEQLREQARILAKKLAAGRINRRESRGEEQASGSKGKGVGPEQGEGNERADEDEGGETATELATDEEDDEAERVQALVAGNKTLSSEVQRLQDELGISNEVTARLESELRSLRFHIRQGIPALGSGTDLPLTLPSPPNSQEERKPPASGSGSAPLNGHKAYRLLQNAEDELLLHAGRAVSKGRRSEGHSHSHSDDRARNGPSDGAKTLPSLTRQPTHDEAAALLHLSQFSTADNSASGTGGDGDQGTSPRASRRRRTSSAGGATRQDEFGWAPPPASLGTSAAAAAAAGVYHSDAKVSYHEGVPEPPAASGSGTRSSNRKRGRTSAHYNEDDEEHSADDSDYFPSPPPVSLAFPATGGGAQAGPLPGGALRRASTGSSGGGVGEGRSSGGRGGGGRPLGQTLSALDVLAQASSSAAQAVGASSSSSRSGSSRKVKPEPMMDDDDYEGAGEHGGGAGGATGPPAKKARLPYTKWNVQEDEQLLKAVIQCGCAWDSVAKLCPTRAYHQVRQRFLRGLRSGETVPPELLHLQPAVLKSVADYEAKKRRKKAAKQQAEQLARAAVEDF
ncbi:hypothetical protein JCM11251_006397 [Rhodosporidiobolus azoricus]